MTLDLAAVLRGTNARVFRSLEGELTPNALTPADLERPFSEVAIDSRSVSPGALFVALTGERTDGHQFLNDAIAAGALGCLVSETRLTDPSLLAAVVANGPSPYLLQVPDTLAALQNLARSWRLRQPATIIGVTGSLGKTTTKEITASLLSWTMDVFKSEANLNTEIGLPLMLLHLKPEHRAAVLEMGMYLPGDIALLAGIARPEIGIVTNVAPIHLERVGSIEGIARGKSELVASLPAGGLAVLNGDDPWTRAMAETSGLASPVLVGLDPRCDYRATDVVAHGLEGVSFTLIAEGRRVQIRTGVPGVHTVHAFLSAAAVGRRLGMSWEEIRESAAEAHLDVRQRILHTPEMMIIDDSYNSAPMSVHAALELLAASPGTKIAVLGDMLELGPGEEQAHRQAGERVADVADWLIIRGPRSAWIAEEAVRTGLPADHVRRAETNAQAAEAVKTIVTEDPSHPWAVLVKGSRGMRMEEVVEGLRGGKR